MNSNWSTIRSVPLAHVEMKSWDNKWWNGLQAIKNYCKQSQMPFSLCWEAMLVILSKTKLHAKHSKKIMRRWFKVFSKSNQSLKFTLLSRHGKPTSCRDIRVKESIIDTIKLKLNILTKSCRNWFNSGLASSKCLMTTFLVWEKLLEIKVITMLWTKVSNWHVTGIISTEKEVLKLQNIFSNSFKKQA